MRGSERNKDIELLHETDTPSETFPELFGNIQ